MRWDDVNARARGLATHLLSRSALEHLAASSDLGHLVQRARAVGLGFEIDGLPAGSATELDLAVGRVAGARFVLLGRWLGRDRRAVLAVFYERIALETLRRLLRGIRQGAAPAARLRGMVPTPEFPERVLRRLAEASSVAELAGRLVRHGHPAGRVLAREGIRREGPVLLRLELGLVRLFAGRAVRLPRRGDPELRWLVAGSVDLWNAATLIEREAWGEALTTQDLWIEGGRVIRERDFHAIANLAVADDRRQRLAERFGSDPFAALVADSDIPAADLEPRALGIWIQRLRAVARERPLGSAPTLHVLLRILAEARDLRAVIWGVALRAPADLVVAGLLAA